MEIKTSQEIYEQVKYTLNDKGWVDEEIIARVAMKAFAKQFIDLAADNIWHQSHTSEKNYNKQVVLDIKQLIK